MCFKPYINQVAAAVGFRQLEAAEFVSFEGSLNLILVHNHFRQGKSNNHNPTVAYETPFVLLVEQSGARFNGLPCPYLLL